MNKKGLTTKDVIIIASIIITIYILKDVLLTLCIIGIFLFIHRKKTPKIEQQPPKKRIPQPQDNFNLDAYRATLAECEKRVQQDRTIRKETDLRQFKGRSDVTRQELAEYMFEQRHWDGIFERRMQMEEIIKVCNLTLDDVNWVEQELKNYHTEGGNVLANRCCYERSEEEKAVWEYQNEQERARLAMEIPKAESDFQRNLAFHKELGFDDDVIQAYENDHKALMNEYDKSLRSCNYDAWLKMKGYIYNE